MDDSKRFISLMSDYGFKIAFADEKDTLFLRKALQALIQSPYEISEVQFLRHEFQGLTHQSRSGVYDLMCMDKNGNFFIVEMQLGYYKNYVQRSKFYAFQKFNTLVDKGIYRFSNLPTIYCIGFLAHKIFPKSELYHHIATLKNQNGDEIDAQMVHVFVEISKFKKEESEIKTDLDKLIFIMKNLENIQSAKVKPFFLSEEWIDRTLKKLDKTKMTREQRMFYEMTLAKNASIREMQEDHDERLIKKVTKELTKEVTKENTITFAKKLKEKGMPLEEISEITGLTFEEIEKL